MRLRALAVLVAAILGLPACGSATAGSTGSTGSAGSPGSAGSGPVDVLYAGSLVSLMQEQLSPGFAQATGYTFTGYSGGSTALASQIKAKVHQGDVFISASPSVNSSLQGASSGNWVSWYAAFASSPLVLGYNPKSSFASALKSEPWNQVVTKPGFRLGTTDPQTDPKGKLAQQALQHVAVQPDVYPEETLVARLQSGQLDAGFFYRSEAVAANIPTVPINQDLEATYTVTVLNNAPHEQAAEAFVKYLLGNPGQHVLKQDGYNLIAPPKVTGSGVPAGLSGVLPDR